MKNIVIASLIALAFTTGFTCSKNAPETTETTTTETTTTQDQMAAPAEGAAATTETGAMGAAPTEAAGAASAGGAVNPASPTNETPGQTATVEGDANRPKK